MLRKLSISNYAIIDHLVIDFSGNLNIITGETGAGKSILMGALNLILGERADTTVLSNKEKKCIIEGFFTMETKGPVRHFFDREELDAEEEIVIRREISSNGKSRSFINDTPVSLAQLKELSVFLVDLHQQFDTLDLADKDFQREVVDALADNAATLSKLKTEFLNYTQAKKKFDDLVLLQQQANKELNYNQFLFDELEELSLKENELEDLEAELKLLSNAESVKQQLVAIYAQLKDSDDPLVSRLKVLEQKMQSLLPFHPSIQSLKERLHTASVELLDIADELEQIDDKVSYDVNRIEFINERLSSGYKLLKKHGVNDTNSLLRILAELSDSLQRILNIGEEIKNSEKQMNLYYEACTSLAGEISSKRHTQVKPFREKVNELLGKVGMPNARIDIRVSAKPLSANGSDDVVFIFDANKSNRFEPLHKVASGGELSRVMLSVKSLVAKKLELPTLIFDEIDTGISGEAARQVGIIMKDLSQLHQVISITHQPQIAARASAHYFVYKEIVADKVVTSVRLLNNDERITAIAKMLSGEKPTAAALENAREMVSN